MMNSSINNNYTKTSFNFNKKKTLNSNESKTNNKLLTISHNIDNIKNYSTISNLTIKHNKKQSHFSTDYNSNSISHRNMFSGDYSCIKELEYEPKSKVFQYYNNRTKKAKNLVIQNFNLTTKSNTLANNKFNTINTDSNNFKNQYFHNIPLYLKDESKGDNLEKEKNNQYNKTLKESEITINTCSFKKRFIVDNLIDDILSKHKSSKSKDLKHNNNSRIVYKLPSFNYNFQNKEKIISPIKKLSLSKLKKIIVSYVFITGESIIHKLNLLSNNNHITSNIDIICLFESEYKKLFRTLDKKYDIKKYAYYDIIHENIIPFISEALIRHPTREAINLINKKINYELDNISDNDTNQQSNNYRNVLNSKFISKENPIINENIYENDYLYKFFNEYQDDKDGGFKAKIDKVKHKSSSIHLKRKITYMTQLKIKSSSPIKKEKESIILNKEESNYKIDKLSSKISSPNKGKKHFTIIEKFIQEEMNILNIRRKSDDKLVRLNLEEIEEIKEKLFLLNIPNDRLSLKKAIMRILKKYLKERKIDAIEDNDNQDIIEPNNNEEISIEKDSSFENSQSNENRSIDNLIKDNNVKNDIKRVSTMSNKLKSSTNNLKHLRSKIIEDNNINSNLHHNIIENMPSKKSFSNYSSSFSKRSNDRGILKVNTLRQRSVLVNKKTNDLSKYSINSKKSKFNEPKEKEIKIRSSLIKSNHIPAETKNSSYIRKINKKESLPSKIPIDYKNVKNKISIFTTHNNKKSTIKAKHIVIDKYQSNKTLQTIDSNDNTEVIKPNRLIPKFKKSTIKHRKSNTQLDKLNPNFKKYRSSKILNLSEDQDSLLQAYEKRKSNKRSSKALLDFEEAMRKRESMVNEKQMKLLSDPNLINLIKLLQLRTKIFSPVNSESSKKNIYSLNFNSFKTMKDFNFNKFGKLITEPVNEPNFNKDKLIKLLKRIFRIKKEISKRTSFVEFEEKKYMFLKNNQINEINENDELDVNQNINSQPDILSHIKDKSEKRENNSCITYNNIEIESYINKLSELTKNDNIEEYKNSKIQENRINNFLVELDVQRKILSLKQKVYSKDNKGNKYK